MKNLLLIILFLSVGFSQKLTEVVETYVDDKDGKWDGLITEYYENVQKKFEGTWKDDGLNGKVNSWYKNGQKWSERTYKNGKLDGLWTSWYENGQKYSETTYKDGYMISEKSF